MRKKLNIIIYIVFGIISVSKSQDIPIQVLNSAGGGGSVGATGYETYYNIGETVISTISSGTTTVTQGFLQPDVMGKFGLCATPLVNHISCIGKQDGAIVVTASISGANSTLQQSQFSYTYFWWSANSSLSLCPTNTCSSISGLPAGSYSVMVVSQYTGTLSIPMDTAYVTNIDINDGSSPCLLEVFNGLTPNGDGVNDFFYIGNIDQYPNNVVDIYNRWGQQLAHIPKYNNMDNKWKGNMNGSDALAPTGTYFYVIDLGEGKSKPIKGWLELLHK